jgi:hypothetical protein
MKLKNNSNFINYFKIKKIVIKIISLLRKFRRSTQESKMRGKKYHQYQTRNK